MHNFKHSGFKILKTYEFDYWLKNLAPKTRLNVLARLDLISIGHWGDYKKFDGLIEFRWKNGLRLYSFVHENKIIILLHGGNKNGQARDIKKAQKFKKEIVKGTRSF